MTAPYPGEIPLLSEYDPRWPRRYDAERARLMAALGALTDGGIVEGIQHVGATSVPGMAARPVVDIALAVWPFPLPGERLRKLGYEVLPGYQAAPEQRFRHVRGVFQLHVVEAGSELWTDYGLFRSYLQHVEKAREAYATARDAAGLGLGEGPETGGKAEVLPRLLGAARGWWIQHQGFGPVDAVASDLEGAPFPWYISSGWALDLFLGRVTRVHHDLDVLVSREDQLSLQQRLSGAGWKWVTYWEGCAETWPPATRLELPRHQAHAHREGEFIDFLLGDLHHGVWRYRRDPCVLRTVEAACLTTAEGIPFLAPEIVLLFKAHRKAEQVRAKDRGDFQAVAPHLDPERRAWLRWALIRTGSDPCWIDQLG